MEWLIIAFYIIGCLVLIANWVWVGLSIYREIRLTKNLKRMLEDTTQREQ